MLTKHSKKVLSQLKKLTHNTDIEFCFVSDVPYFCLSKNMEHFYDYSKYSNEIGSIIEQLIDEKYILPTFNQYHFQLTQKSIHLSQFKLHTVKIYIAEKWISITALVISILSFPKSYGHGIDDIFTACMQLLKK